jgi:hypothetical protein
VDKPLFLNLFANTCKISAQLHTILAYLNVFKSMKLMYGIPAVILVVVLICYPRHALKENRRHSPVNGTYVLPDDSIKGQSCFSLPILAGTTDQEKYSNKKTPDRSGVFFVSEF